MKSKIKYIAVGAAMICGSACASAQWYELANQIPQMIQPALTGGFNYKGFVETDFVAGVGNHSVHFLGFSTSQGLRYSNWFYMGVGLGLDVVFSNADDTPIPSDPYYGPDFTDRTTGVMLPIFTDFRFNVGNQKGVSFYADIKLGCSFLIGNSYMRVDHGWLTSREYFLLKPNIGVRIPVMKNDSRKAFDIGLTYQLLTSNYWWYNATDNITLNALGITVAYEW